MILVEFCNTGFICTLEEGLMDSFTWKGDKCNEFICFWSLSEKSMGQWEWAVYMCWWY